MKKIKKLLSLLLIFTFIFPNLVMATGEISVPDSNESIEKIKLKDKEIEKLEKQLLDSEESKLKIEESILEEPEEQTNKKVKVIVELEDKPLIEVFNLRGRRLDDINEATVQSEENRILNEQDNIIDEIDNNGIEFEEPLNRFTNVLNGFSVEVKESDIEKIQEIEGVKTVETVNEYYRPEPDMNSSSQMVQAQTAWDLDYKGEGMVVAVLDTGVDPKHKDFKLTDENKITLISDDVNEKITENRLDGRWLNNKIPYSYNYYDKDSEPFDSDKKSQHGMHVAGTVLANGDISNGGIKGIAPEAQLLNMKVFSNDPNIATTSSDIYIKAIDDSIILGADSINMSLGSPAGVYSESSIEHQAISRAEEAGIIVTISSGNARNIVYNSASNTNLNKKIDILKHNPDTGLVGSPSTSISSTTIASFENNVITGTCVKTEIQGSEKIILTEASPIKFSTLSNTEGYGYIYLETGKEEEFEKNKEEIKGKVALVMRGESFANTIQYAQEYGAIGCLVFNHEAGGDTMVSMAGGDNATIPFAFIFHSHGKALVENIENTKLVFPTEGLQEDNALKGHVSESSSWGTTPDLRLKPEVMAPGNNIWSTQNNNSYTSMSGTSMAAPHVAGGSVLVKDYVKNNSKIFNISSEELSLLVRNLLMNTADVKNQPGTETPFSPRLQGAGMMNLAKATANKVTIVDNNENNTSAGYAKVELGEVDNNLNFNLKIKNYSDEEIKYSIEIIALNEIIENGKLKEKFEIVNSSANTESTVIGKGEIIVDLTLDISNANNNQYIDGFIKFKALDKENKDLVVPFVGFKGDWNEPRIVDTLDATYRKVTDPEKYIEKDKKESQFKSSSILESRTSGGLYFKDPNSVYFKPDQTKDGKTTQYSRLLPRISQLRNAKNMRYLILDKNKEELRTLGNESNVRKLYNLGSKVNNVSVNPFRDITRGYWDGKINSNYVDDGRYYYRIESTLTYKDYKQEDDYKIIVDRVAPELSEEKTWFNDDKILKFGVNDIIGEGLTIEDISGFYSIAINGEYVNEDIVEISEINKEKDLYEVSLDLSNYFKEKNEEIKIQAVDKSGNLSEYAYVINGSIDKSKLAEKIAEAEAILDNKDKYTEESIEELERVITVAREVLNNIDATQEEIENAISELDTAIKSLVEKERPEEIDKSELIGKIAEAEEKLKYQEYYTDESIVELEKAIEEAKEILNNIDVTQEEINQVVDILQEAIDNLELIDEESKPELDKSKLAGKIAEADAILDNKNKYTEETIENLKDAIKDANLVFSKENVTQEEINQAVNILQEAIDNLVEKERPEEIETTKLRKLIEEVKLINKDKYTEESIKALEKALEEAEKVLTQEDLTQEDIDVALTNLQNAKDELKEKVEPLDKSKLEEKIKEAEAIRTSKYTDSTVEKLKEAIKEAKEILKKEDLTQNELDRALKNLIYAINGLKEKEESGGGSSSGGDSSSGGYSSSSSLSSSSGTKPKEKETGKKEPEVKLDPIKEKIDTENRIAYIEGYKDGTIKPEKAVTREELATIITRLLKEDYKKEIKLKEMRFKDIKEGRWSEESIQLLYSMDLIKGYEDNTFRPTENITRAEFVTIISRLAELKDINIKINLTDISKHWAKEDIEKVISKSWIKGYEDNSFKPNNNLTRAELTTVLNKVLERGDDYLKNIDKNISMKDLSEDKWYYKDMLKAIVK